MSRLTRKAVDVEPGAVKYFTTETHLMSDWSDKMIDLVLNGPTLNGFRKDEVRAMLRETYAALKAREEADEAAAERLETLTRAVDTYGAEAQLKMMLEEMSELSKAICKLWRAKPGPELEAATDSIREEAADVQIMLDQLRIMFGGTERDEAEKIGRLRCRLDDHDRAAGRPESEGEPEESAVVHGTLVLPCREDGTEPQDESWELVTCPVCGADCWESDEHREIMAKSPGLSVACSACVMTGEDGADRREAAKE